MDAQKTVIVTHDPCCCVPLFLSSPRPLTAQRSSSRATSRVHEPRISFCAPSSRSPTQREAGRPTPGASWLDTRGRGRTAFPRPVAQPEEIPAPVSRHRVHLDGKIVLVSVTRMRRN